MEVIYALMRFLQIVFLIVGFAVVLTLLWDEIEDSIKIWKVFMRKERW